VTCMVSQLPADKLEAVHIDKFPSMFTMGPDLEALFVATPVDQDGTSVAPSFCYFCPNQFAHPGRHSADIDASARLDEPTCEKTSEARRH